MNYEWPFLEKLLKSQNLAYSDYALAQTILKNDIQAAECVAVLICHLSLASRKGNLCVLINQTQLLPDTQTLWSDLESGLSENNLSPQDLIKLNKMILEGSKTISSKDCAEVDESVPFPNTPICRLGDLYYFQRYWVYETLFIEQLKKVTLNKPSIQLDSLKVSQQLDLLKQKLLPEQIEAISLATQNSLSIICGGPGTGKTYTAAELIKIYWNSLSLDQRQTCEIALAAPTGKAAANLQSSLCRVLDSLENFPLIQAKTMHALLGVQGKKSVEDIAKNILTADLILIDESSMIDLYLMTYLFSSIKPGARLILLGDRYQLPPVEAGTLFSDLVTYLLNRSPSEKYVAELKKCLRAELQHIIDFAHMVNQGNQKIALELLNSNEPSNPLGRLPFLEESRTKEIHLSLLNHSLKYFQPIESLDQPLNLLHSYNRFRLLSPFRKGPFGVDQLNALFFNSLLKQKKQGPLIVPIMLTHNDRRLELSNGEVGVLIRYSSINDSFQEGDYALFPSKKDQSVSKFPALLLPKYEYAFCLSVHKSQGSEFDHILLIAPKGSESFGREVLYTAVTRAKRKLEILVSDETLSHMISRPSQRLSGISKRIKIS